MPQCVGVGYPVLGNNHQLTGSKMSPQVMVNGSWSITSEITYAPSTIDLLPPVGRKQDVIKNQRTMSISSERTYAPQLWGKKHCRALL